MMIKFESLQEIIDFAIDKEQEAADFYENLADDAEDVSITKELLRIRDEEIKHRDWLRYSPISFLSDAKPKQVNDLNIAQYIMPINPSEKMNFQDVIAIAMQRELMSMHLYTQLSSMVSDPTIRQALLNLSAEEGKHKFYFETLWDRYVLSED
jgi:rubrerythrin